MKMTDLLNQATNMIARESLMMTRDGSFVSQDGIRIYATCRLCHAPVQQIWTAYSPSLHCVEVFARCHGMEYVDRVTDETALEQRNLREPIFLEFGNPEELYGLMRIPKPKDIKPKFKEPEIPKRKIDLKGDE